MRIAAISAVVFIFLFIGYNKSTAQEIYQRTYGGTLYQVGQAILETDDKGFLLGGNYRHENPIQTDVLIIKTDSMGNQQWAKTYGSNRSEFLNKIIKTQDGNYIGIGWTESFGLIGIGEFGDTVRGDALIFKFDAQGSILWSKVFGDSLRDFYRSIIEKLNGDLLICGVTNNYGADNKSDALVCCIDKDGNMKWSKKVKTSFDYVENAGGINLASEGGFYVSGFVEDAANFTYQDYFLLKADSTGRVIWSKVFNDSLSSFQQETRTDSAGFIYYSYPTAGAISPYNDLNLIKMDSSGSYIWGIKLGNSSSGDHTPNAFTILSNGNLLLSSYNIILRIDSSNGTLLKTSLVGYISMYNEVIYSMIEKSDKGIALFGTSGDPIKFLLSNIDSSGTSCVPSSFIMPNQAVHVQPTDYYFADTLVTLTQTNVSFTINDISVPDSIYCNTLTSVSSLTIDENELNVFPNPFHNIVQIKTRENNEAVTQIEIRDISGRTVFITGKYQEFIDLSNLADGIYFITLSSNSFVITKKIIKH